MISQTISHYNILEVIGEGGMGIVYKARDMNLDRLVAIKLMPPSLSSDKKFTNQFIHEARIISQLEHPNICTIHEFDISDKNQLFIVMAYCHGQTLEHMIKDSSPLPLQQILDISCQICKGLSVAHQAGIIHRDLKPANIIINNNGDIKILDFGLAGLQEEISKSTSLKSAGTVAYMSPEQLFSNSIDKRTDLWSFGVMMYQMLSGRLPFDAPYEQSQTYAILKEEQLPISRAENKISAPLIEIINKSLQKDPERRFQNASDINKELEEIRNHEFPSKHIFNKRINRQILSAAAIFLFIIISLVTYLFSPFSANLERPIRIAVLSFSDLSSESEGTYFGKGVSEEIRSKLAVLKEFSVIPGQSIENIDHEDYNLDEIAEKYNVDFILDGSIQKTEGRIRLIPQLISAENEEIIWTNTYDREITDIFKIQADVAKNIAASVRIELTSRQKNMIEKRGTSDPIAYDYYLRGGQYYMRLNARDNEIAIQLYKKALSLDNKFAAAHARLSIAYTHRALPFGTDRVWYDSALVAANKAVAHDPDCPEGYFALGILYARVGTYKNASYDKAFAAYSRALDLLPNDYRALYLMGQLKRYLGLYEDALDHFKRAIDSNPMASFAHAEMGISYMALGDYESAEKKLIEALEITPDLGHARTPLAELYLRQERYDDAVDIYKRGITLNPGHHWHHHDMGIAFKNGGYFEQAITALERAIEFAPNERWHYLGLASIYRDQKQLNKALSTYEKTFASFPNDLSVALNYSILLAELGQEDKAYMLVHELLSNPSLEYEWMPDIIVNIGKFYLGEIEEDSLNAALAKASNEWKDNRQVISCYYYKAMAHLLCLKKNYIKTKSDTIKAMNNFEKYVLNAAKDDVEYSLARSELKKLKQIYE